MASTTVRPRVKALFDEIIMAADEYITLSTAQRLATELGIDFDPQDFDRSY